MINTDTTNNVADPLPTRYTVELSPLPCDVPAVTRLQKFLKQALRTYRLRCIRVTETPAAAPEAARDTTTKEEG
jgi:hypothetical protein